MDDLKRLVRGALVLFIGLFFALFVGVGINEISEGGRNVCTGMASLIMAAINGVLLWRLLRPMLRSSKPKELPEPEVSPEMDHIDDMAMQYNPYFADVYEQQQQEALQRQQEQIRKMMEQQLEQQQMHAEILQKQEALQAEILTQQAEEMRRKAEELERQAEAMRVPRQTP
ncbi:MAG: hypothetical protein IKX54_04780 [Lachnospiraceae bacterium]|nr:hypothetical protein [Lachnospiraceae bacterium]